MVINSPIGGNRLLKWIPMLSAWVVLAGCVSPAKRACIETDWKRVGYEEGRQGSLAERSALQRDRCIREGVPPDTAQYEQGRKKGIEKYCTADNGYALGVKGDAYQGACPPELKRPFVDAYQKGLIAYAQQLERDFKAKADLQNKMRLDLAGVEEETAYLEKEIEQATEGQARLRMGMISEMRMLEDDQQSLALQISALEMDLEEMRLQLSRIRSQAGALDQ